MPPFKVASDATVVPREKNVFIGTEYNVEREKTALLLNKC